jgi:hypothetical protein
MRQAEIPRRWGDERDRRRETIGVVTHQNEDEIEQIKRSWQQIIIQIFHQMFEAGNARRMVPIYKTLL